MHGDTFVIKIQCDRERKTVSGAGTLSHDGTFIIKTQETEREEDSKLTPTLAPLL